MDRMAGALVLTDLFDVESRQDDYDWQPFREGVDIFPLYRDPDSGASAALLRYRPGARVPAHAHPGYEHIFVLAGAQSDERGTYRKGCLLISLPGTGHSVSSPEGCIVLGIWQKPVEFSEADKNN